MIIFQVLKKNMAVIGLVPKQQQSNQWTLNGRHKVSLICHCIAVISNIVFIFSEANGVEEYMAAIFVTSASSAVAMSFINLIHKNDEIFNVIEGCEKELTTSKSCLIPKTHFCK